MHGACGHVFAGRNRPCGLRLVVSEAALAVSPLRRVRTFCLRGGSVFREGAGFGEEHREGSDSLVGPQ
jgi:hypothetical protein